MSNYTKGILAAIGVYLFWGFTLLASTFAQRAASPMVLLMYRFDIACIILMIPVLLGKQKIRPKREDIKWLILIGLMEPAIYFIGEQYGMKYTNSSFTGIMIATIPIVTMLVAAVFLHEKPSRLQWIFSAISVLGVIAITIFNSSGDGGVVTVHGFLLLVVAVLSATGYSVLSRAVADRCTVFERTLVSQIVGAVFFTVLAVAEHSRDLTVLYKVAAEPIFIIPALYVAVFASALGYILFNYALEKAPIANVISLNNLVTILSVASGVIFLDEPFSLKAGIAMVVVLIGIWGVQRFGPEHSASRAVCKQK